MQFFTLVAAFLSFSALSHALPLSERQLTGLLGSLPLAGVLGDGQTTDSPADLHGLLGGLGGLGSGLGGGLLGDNATPRTVTERQTDIDALIELNGGIGLLGGAAVVKRQTNVDDSLIGGIGSLGGSGTGDSVGGGGLLGSTGVGGSGGGGLLGGGAGGGGLLGGGILGLP